MSKLINVFSIFTAFCACSVNQAQSLKNVAQRTNVKRISNNAPNTSTTENSGVHTIRPSNIITALRKVKDENPNMTAKELADFGNKYKKKHGYDYTFHWKPKGKENEANLSKMEKGYYQFFYKFSDLSGKTAGFQLMNDNFEHPCFSVIDIPLTKISEKTMTVIADGKEINLKRPKDFYLEEFALVDKTLKKQIRKWKTPIDALPVGISEDGTKVYFDSWEFEQDETEGYEESAIDLAVEISEDGSLKLVDRSEIKSDKGVDIDYNKKFTEIIYKKYKVGAREYIINFSAPCT